MIRQANEKDLIQIKSLMKLVISSLSEHYDKKIIKIWSNTLISEIDEEFPLLTLFVYEKKNTILGMGALKDAHIERVYVNPKYQKQGIGSEIMKQLELTAKRKGISKLDLNTTSNAFEFYKNRGYKKVGVTTHEKEGVSVSFTKMVKEI